MEGQKQEKQEEKQKEIKMMFVSHCWKYRLTIIQMNRNTYQRYHIII